MLNPFTVSTEGDSGYRAANSISGTRLNTAIKDTPMPIEVITRQFIEDTGSVDLREALRYSSGVILESQNDLGVTGANAYQGPGGVNNPEGATANPQSGSGQDSWLCHRQCPSRGIQSPELHRRGQHRTR